MDVDYSSLTDKELSEMLKDYGVDVGPVNMATRKAYERKLHKLKTGEAMPAARKYEPVANDDEDQEVQFKPTPAPSKPQTRYQPVPTSPEERIAEPSSARLRRDPVERFTPHIDSRPSLNSARKTTLSYEPRKLDRSPAKSSDTDSQSESKSGLPMWIKLTAVAVVVFLLYLVYINMESNAATNIPKIPSKMEV